MSFKWKKRPNKVTPGQFIKRVKKDLLAHTDANSVNAEFELNIEPSGNLSEQQAQRVRLCLALVRKTGASRRE